jgi:hypothetical protein
VTTNRTDTTDGRCANSNTFPSVRRQGTRRATHIR